MRNLQVANVIPNFVNICFFYPHWLIFAFHIMEMIWRKFKIGHLVCFTSTGLNKSLSGLFIFLWYVTKITEFSVPFCLALQHGNAASSKESIVGPEGWEWTSEWNADTNRAVDEDGKTTEITNENIANVVTITIGDAMNPTFAGVDFGSRVWVQARIIVLYSWARHFTLFKSVLVSKLLSNWFHLDGVRNIHE